MHKSDIDYLILKILKDNPKITQRQLSKELGLSLGRTNYVIHALIDKGWVKFSNFRRSDNKLAYLYALTPEGIANKSLLAQNFFIRKSKQYNKLKEEIKMLEKEIQENQNE